MQEMGNLLRFIENVVARKQIDINLNGFHGNRPRSQRQQNMHKPISNLNRHSTIRFFFLFLLHFYQNINKFILLHHLATALNQFDNTFFISFFSLSFFILATHSSNFVQTIFRKWKICTSFWLTRRPHFERWWNELKRNESEMLLLVPGT